MKGVTHSTRGEMTTCLHRRKGNHALREGGMVSITPLERPVCLLLDTGYGFDGAM